MQARPGAEARPAGRAAIAPGLARPRPRHRHRRSGPRRRGAGCGGRRARPGAADAPAGAGESRRRRRRPLPGRRHDQPAAAAGIGRRRDHRLRPPQRARPRSRDRRDRPRAAAGGRFLSLDFEKPAHAGWRRAYFAYLTVVGATVGTLLHGDADTCRYIPSLARIRAPTPSRRRLRAAGVRRRAPENGRLHGDPRCPALTSVSADPGSSSSRDRRRRCRSCRSDGAAWTTVFAFAASLAW